jgi:hypothetical protein
MLPVLQDITETLTYYCKHTQIEEVLFTMKIFIHRHAKWLPLLLAPSMVVDAGCKKEGQDCVDVQKLEYMNNGLKCTIAWDEKGRFGPQCVSLM